MDTPRTDALWSSMNIGMIPLSDPLSIMLLHARELERELISANSLKIGGRNADEVVREQVEAAK